MPESSTRSESRLLLGSVLLAVSCGLLSGTFISDAPPADADGQQVLAWYQKNAQNIRWSIWMLTVGVPPGLFMFARLRRLLPGTYRDVYFLGAVGVALMPVIPAMIMGGLALHVGQLEAATARTVHDVSLFFGPILTGFTVTMMTPVTVLAFRRDAFVPRWVGLFGAIAILEQAVETITIFGTTGFTEPGGAMNLRLGAALVTGWMLVFGLWGALRGIELVEMARSSEAR